MTWKSPHGRKLPERVGPPLIMGILNVSSDSFSDGGEYSDMGSALERVACMLQEGADFIDIGAESTRPGAVELSESAEMDLLMPKLEKIRADFPDLAISVDTYKPSVARAAISAGADIINDVRMGSGENAYPMAQTAAELACPIIITHNSRGRNFKISHFLSEMDSLVSLAMSEGMVKSQIILDPGIGFGKTERENIEILRELSKLRELDCPVLLGVSRKSMFKGIVGDDFSDRDDASAAVSAIAAFQNSADILRVHDVRKTFNAVKTAYKIGWTK